MSKPPVKVGDELAGKHRFGGWKTYTVDRITPSGRVVCGDLALDPNLRVRGRDTWSNLPYCLQRMTPQIKEKIKRQQLVETCLKLINSTQFSSLETSKLQTLVKLLTEAQP